MADLWFQAPHTATGLEVIPFFRAEGMLRALLWGMMNKKQIIMMT